MTSIRDDLDVYSEYRTHASGGLVWGFDDLGRQPQLKDEIATFLRGCDLELDGNLVDFVTVRAGRRLVACAGMGENVIKCVAVSPELRGRNITARLITEVSNLAAEMGRWHLFLYSRPEKAALFSRCGFHPLVEIPGVITLLENTPTGLARYRDALAAQRKPGARIGCIVMNANPFTLGHRYLVERAVAECDWVHVFVVGEKSSLVTYDDRHALVVSGLQGLPRTTVHPGSVYMISKVTFPSYFLKDQGIVDRCHTALDLILFREHIAPALGVTHRYVGTEPYCAVTHKYNADMKDALMAAPSRAPAITVVEVARKAHAGRAISASDVRRCLRADDYARMAELVPPATVALLQAKYFDPRARVATGTG